MNREYILYCGIFLIGVFISAFAQIMLKKSADKVSRYTVFALLNKYTPNFADKLRKSENRFIKLLRGKKKLLSEYLNIFTMSAYAVFVIATFLTIFSYRVVPLSAAPILGASEYFFVAALSRIFLKEKINAKKLLGLMIIFVGIMVYSFEKIRPLLMTVWTSVSNLIG